MLRINRDGGTFTRLEQRSLTQQGITERYDLQRMIRNSPEEFFKEMGEEMLMLGEEVRPADFIVEDRIDLLGIDKQGAAVVIELKRNSHKLQLLQALSYAAMISKWDAGQLVDERCRLSGKTSEEVNEEIEQFMVESPESLNAMQRVVLVAEDYDFEILAAAEWLNERYGVDIRCFRLELSADGSAEYLNCTCIYPAPELAQHAIRRSRKGLASSVATVPWDDWNTALAQVSNPDMVSFFQAELASGQENYLQKRLLRYRIKGIRQFFVKANKKEAYVWQHNRFTDDVAFWKSKIGDHIELSIVNQDRSLRFFLTTQKDFQAFKDVVEHDLQKVAFTNAGEMAEEEVGV